MLLRRGAGESPWVVILFAVRCGQKNPDRRYRVVHLPQATLCHSTSTLGTRAVPHNPAFSARTLYM
jgi:hypothetical protein